jgi:hypothetical protein
LGVKGGVERIASLAGAMPPFPPPRTDSGVSAAALERGLGGGGVRRDAVVLRGEERERIVLA